MRGAVMSRLSLSVPVSRCVFRGQQYARENQGRNAHKASQKHTRLPTNGGSSVAVQPCSGATAKNKYRLDDTPVVTKRNTVSRVGQRKLAAGHILKVRVKPKPRKMPAFFWMRILRLVFM